MTDSNSFLSSKGDVDLAASGPRDVLLARRLLEVADWSGEDEPGQIARFVGRRPDDELLRPLIVLPPLVGMFFATVAFMATRTWGFAVVSGVGVLFGSFVVLAIAYLLTDVADSSESRVGPGANQDWEHSR
ncbi:hypothetical protein [Microbacterium algeriense]|uniref:hypothetical protein n=1 Tax=Microbacterium algeriense TaxID=2615184 RepID=UPI0029A83099|nr:hypothetical protein [Microbacterium algeriense]MDX2401408.1 hypothetical protein [Microbacterium algeriense]